MGQIMDRLEQALSYVRTRTDFIPEIGLILGSGLGSYGEKLDIVDSISYSDIPGFPVSTVQGHAGKYLFGTIGGVKVCCMQGRVHSYEGYEMADVVMPVRLMGLLGAKILFLTNAAGGINPSFHAGDLMLITDQISSFMPSPLIGPNEEELGVRFPDMSEIYSKNLQEAILTAAQEMNFTIQEGVYLQFRGPQFESPAEIRMAGHLGADAVGMSTAIEAIAARHMGMQVCGISCITNMAAGISASLLTHTEVQETADRIEKEFSKLITLSLAKIADSMRL